MWGYYNFFMYFLPPILRALACSPVLGISGRVLVAGQKAELSHSGDCQVQRAKVHPVQSQLRLSGTAVLYLGELMIKKQWKRSEKGEERRCCSHQDPDG